MNDTADLKLAKLLPMSDRIPAFFFAHGSPALLPEAGMGGQFGQDFVGGPTGPHARFLEVFGKHILETYKPRAIVVFSAHFESDPIQILDNTHEFQANNLLYDYYGFPDNMYKIKFDSRGDHEIASKIASLLERNNIETKVIKNKRGLDHGCFVPFKLMFPDPCPIPIVEVAQDDGLDPQRNLDIGRALESLRDEGILILSGGLTIHTFKDFSAWSKSTAAQGYLDFETAIKEAAVLEDGSERNKKLIGLTKHKYFRLAHPREEHFTPLYVAAGAGSRGKAAILSDLHSAITIAFGL